MSERRAPVGHDIVMVERAVDAPPQRVFEKLVDPDAAARWWAPEPLESVRIDPRIGGRYRLTMVDRAGGAEYPCEYVIVELHAPETLVLQAEPGRGRTDGGLIQIELARAGPGATLTLTAGPFPAARLADAEAGWRGSLERLAQLAAS